MKYRCEIEINKPLERVLELFDNTENLFKWMEGLQSFEHLEGEPGKPGAKSKMVFKMNNKDVEMIETINVRNLPKEFSGSYDAKGVHNIQKNSFEKIDDNRTRYITHNEFHFKGFMKFMALMPGAFKKQTMKYMRAFKSFVESEA